MNQLKFTKGKPIRKLKLTMLTVMAAVSLSACIPEENIESVDDIIENGGAYEMEIKEKMEDKELGSIESGDKPIVDVQESIAKDSKEENLKVLSTYKIEAETVKFESFLKDVLEKTHKLEGYISKKNVEKISNTNKNKAEISIKVPRENLANLVTFLEEELSIRSESFSTVDVTDRYYSVEKKIETLQMKEERLLNLYEKTTDISKIIEIDDKLAEVIEQKEEELRKKGKIEGGVALSRVDINLTEVGKFTDKSDNKEPLDERLSKGIKETTSGFLAFGVETILFLMKLIPFLLGGGLLFVIFNKYFKKYFIEDNKGSSEISIEEKAYSKDKRSESVEEARIEAEDESQKKSEGDKSKDKKE